MSFPRSLVTGALTSMLAVATSVVVAAAQGPSPAADAAAYCTDHGGTVQTRQAMWGTNSDPSLWLDLGRSIDLCRFQTLDDEAKSRIYVDLVTLSATTPTLASVAYLAKAPVEPTTGSANPATLYCADLAASASFGQGASGGGWVAMDDPDDVVVGMCVFPDGSMIDEWGLAYHSNDVVRGADLATVFAYQAEELPPFFGSGE